MNIPLRRSASNNLNADARLEPAVHSFAPDDQPPPRRAAAAGLPPEFSAAPSRMRYRVRLVWLDPSAPSGRREEIRAFTNPASVINLLERVRTNPDRPLASPPVIEGSVKPKWIALSPEYMAWRGHQRQRRDESKRGVR
jgi:hypothetical protein